jgi:hypothetical protein
MNSKRTRQVPLFFGPVPVEALNRALGMELEAGDAVMSVNAQKHAQRRHPIDYPHCLPHVAAVINNPLYVRDDFRNHGRIELVGRPASLPDYLLVAVEVVLDTEGRYNVTSFYPLSEKKVANRRDSGHLIRVVLI